MAGAIDLFSGDDSLSGVNLFKVDRNPLERLDEGIAGILQQTEGILDGLEQLLKALIDKLIETCTNAFVTGLRLFGFPGTLIEQLGAGIQHFVDQVLGFIFCDQTGSFTPQIILDILGTASGIILGNPFVQGLINLAEEIGQTTGPAIMKLFHGALGGLQQICSLLTTGLFPTQYGNWDGTPQGLIATIYQLVQLVFNNPIVANLREFVLEPAGHLVLDSLAGLLELFNRLLAFLGDFTPQGAIEFLEDSANILWRLLTGNIEGVGKGIADIIGVIAENPLAIFTPLNTLLGGAFTTFIKNLSTFFNGMGLFDGVFSAATAAQKFLENITNQLVAWVTQNVLGGVNPSTFLTNLGTLFGSANPLSTAFSAAGAVTAFLNNITTQLVNWVAQNVLGGLSPGSFFDGIGPGSLFSRVSQWIEAAVVRAFTGKEGGTWQDLVPKIPTIDQLVHTFLGTTPDGISAPDLGALGGFVNTLLHTNSPIPAENIFGTIAGTVLGQIPVGNIGFFAPNLITMSRFEEEANANLYDGWEWDAATTYDGALGAIRFNPAVAGDRYLVSDQDIAVSTGDAIEVSVRVRTSSDYAGYDTPLELFLVLFNEDTQIGETSVASASAATPTPRGSTFNAWAQMVGTYTVPSGVTSVRLMVGVGPEATGGYIWFDDFSLKKTGLLGQNLVNQLIPAWQALGQTIFGGVPQAVNDVVNFVGNIGTQIASAAGTALTNGLTAIGQIGTLGTQLFDGFVNFVSTGVNNLGNFVAKIGTAIVDGIGSTLSGFIGGVQYVGNRGRLLENTGYNYTPTPIITGFPVTASTFPQERTIPEMLQALEKVVTTTYDTNFTTNTHSDFFNTPRSIPAWVGADTDDVSFPQTLIDGTAVSTPPLGRMVMIPVTAQQKRTFDAIRIGLKSNLGVFNMTNLYVGLYDVDETTGKCTKVIGDELGINGDCRAFLDPQYDIQTIPIGQNVGGVIKYAQTENQVTTLTLTSDPGPALKDKSVVVAGLGTASYNGIKTITSVVQDVPVGGDPHYYNTTLLLRGEPGSIYPSGQALPNGGVIDIYDDSGFGGGVLTSVNAVTSSTQKKFNDYSLYFDGTSAYARRNANNVMKAADFTLEAWVYPTGYPPTTGQNRFAGIYSHQSVQNYGGWENLAHTLLLLPDGGLYYGMGTGNIADNLNTGVNEGEQARRGIGAPAGSVPLNTWTHIAVVRNKDTLKLFVNGAVVSTSDIGSVTMNFFSTNGVELVGLYQDASPITGYFKGYIDELRITKNVARYTEAFTPPVAPFGNIDNAPLYQIKYAAPGAADGSSLVSTYSTVTLPSPKTVDRGELFYIGVLQVGGSANGLHKWTKEGELTTGQYPRYIGSTYNSVAAINTDSIGALPEYILNKDISAGDKCWGALGAYKPYVAKGSVFYADSFNRTVGSSVGISWVNKYGSPLIIKETSDLTYSTPYTAEYSVGGADIIAAKPYSNVPGSGAMG